MIHAFAVEPQVVATWARRGEFRYFRDKFGLGAPRVLLELPEFVAWKRAAHAAGVELALSDSDMKRLEELFKLFGSHKVTRTSAVYRDVASWLENAEREFDRRSFAAIVSTENPRRHRGVVTSSDLEGSRVWDCPRGALPDRTPEAVTAALHAMLSNCRVLHFIDPHFGPENARHRRVLFALLDVVARNGLESVPVHICCSDKAPLRFFEQEAAALADRLPNGISVGFTRLRERAGGEKLHNRYVLTDLGGVSLGVGLDDGKKGESDDILLLPAENFERRWNQYVGQSGFDVVDRPSTVVGRRALTPPPRPFSGKRRSDR